MALIYYLSSAPVQADLPEIKHFDKVLHFIAYGVLGICYWLCLVAYKCKKSYSLAVLFSFIYGCSDEFHQSYIPGRTPDVFDIVADTSGALVCVFVANCLYLYYLKRNGLSS
jgi:VanZ family protein